MLNADVVIEIETDREEDASIKYQASTRVVKAES